MGILSSSDSGNQSTEEKIESEEQQIIKHMEKVNNKLGEALVAEENLINALEGDGSRDLISQRLSDLEIYLEKDIDPKVETINSEINSMESLENKVDEKGRLTEDHRELVEFLEQIRDEIIDEEQKLAELAEKANKLIRESEISNDDVLKKLRPIAVTEEKESKDIHSKLEQAEEMEKQIVRNH